MTPHIWKKLMGVESFLSRKYLSPFDPVSMIVDLVVMSHEIEESLLIARFARQRTGHEETFK